MVRLGLAGISSTTSRWLAALSLVALPAVTQAGELAQQPAPVLGESGLLALGAALGVAGVLVMRRKRK